MPIVEVNFEEVKQNLIESTKEYKQLIVTEETLSICKGHQKDLAGLRIKIDNYRKNVKKELSKPITEFEDKMKILVALVEDAEQPLKDGIQVFDDKKREEKKQTALQIIAEVVEKHGIKEKYSSQLTVVDKYMNLTAKTSEVKEDVEQRAFILIGQQQKEEEMLEIIQDTITNVNKTIKKQVDISSVQWMINKDMPTREIIQSINSLAKQIWEAENPKPVEPVVEVSAQPIQEVTQSPITEVKADTDLYYVEMRVVATKESIAELGQWLRDKNYNYTVSKKGLVE
jgi:hypothetical protein